MKTVNVIIISIILCGNAIYAQNINWDWAKQSENYWGLNVCVKADDSGNSVVTGFFYNYNIEFNGQILTNNGDDDIYLLKYSTSGDIKWAKSFGGTNRERPSSMAIDNEGNIYLIGFFNSNILAFDSIILTSQGQDDIFLTKLDTNGNVIWAKSYGTTNVDAAYDVATDNIGNVYFIGAFDTYNISIDSIILTNHGNWDGLIAKLNSYGDVQWAHSISSNSYDCGESIIVDSMLNVYTTGYFRGYSVTIDSITLTNTGGDNEIFLAKFNSNGNIIWATSAVGVDSDWGDGLSIDNHENIYLKGATYSPVINFGNNVLLNTGDIQKNFIVKYNNSGQAIWAKIIDGFLEDMTVNPASDVILTGHFSSHYINFDTVLLINNSDSTFNGMSIVYGSNIYIVAYDSLGNVKWGENIEGKSAEAAYSICMDKLGNYFLIGNYNSDSLSFGTFLLFNPNIISVFENAFLAKFNFNLITSFDNYTSHLNIRVFPNPANDKITLKTSTFSKYALISIYNIKGQLLLNKVIKKEEMQIDITAFAKGMYFLKMKTDKGITIKKFIKQ